MSGICDTFSGSTTGEVQTINLDAIPEPDTLHIRMTRGECRIFDYDALLEWLRGEA